MLENNWTWNELLDALKTKDGIASMNGTPMSEIQLSEIEVENEWHGRNYARNEKLFSVKENN